MKYYFAYGSNLNLEYMAKRCPSSKVIGKGKLVNYTLTCQGNEGEAYFNIVPKKDEIVPVGIFAVEEEDIQALDEYEDYPIMYDRKEMTIQNEADGKDVTGFIYIMNDNYPINQPTGKYVVTCLKGYRDFGFDESFLVEKIFESIFRNKL